MVEDNPCSSSGQHKTAITKFDPKVFQLGYVALETPEFEKTKDHYLETIGMTETANLEDGSTYLSIGCNSHDIVLEEGRRESAVASGLSAQARHGVEGFRP